MIERCQRGPEPAGDWSTQFFYFGNAVWPSSATYRTSGERIQLRIELDLGLASEDNLKYVCGTEKVVDFIKTYSDCSFELIASSEPGLFLVGWHELESDEERARYFETKDWDARRYEPKNRR